MAVSEKKTIRLVMTTMSKDQVPSRKRTMEPQSSAIIRLDTPLKKSYVRTRHNNIRCFPKCSPFHMEQRFCGRSLDILVHETSVPQELRKPEALEYHDSNVFVFAEFRNTSSRPLFHVGKVCEKEVLRDKHQIMFAKFVKMQGDGWIRYSIAPQRKWQYPGRTRNSDLHVVQLYLVVCQVVTGVSNSDPFRVIPIWKSSEGRRLKEQLLREEQEQLELRGEMDTHDGKVLKEKLAQVERHNANAAKMASNMEPGNNKRIKSDMATLPNKSPAQDEGQQQQTDDDCEYHKGLKLHLDHTLNAPCPHSVPPLGYAAMPHPSQDCLPSQSPQLTRLAPFAGMTSPYYLQNSATHSSTPGRFPLPTPTTMLLSPLALLMMRTNLPPRGFYQ